MELARVLVCLCVCVLAGVVHGQVASICRPKERLLMCGGCQKTCLDPVPDCKGVCRPGCYCADDEVRNDLGYCVKLSECPPLPASYNLETTEPRPAHAECPENEEYKFCEPCMKTCDNPNPICPAQCWRGCFCKADLVRDRDGRCVELEKCSNKPSNEIPHSPVVEKPTEKPPCGPNQVFKSCGKCPKSCSNPNRQCPDQPEAECIRGCFCKDGLYETPNGDCVTIDKCPTANSSVTEKPTEVPPCGPNHVFKSCGSSCPKSCSNPNRQCPDQPEAECIRGCFCNDGLYETPNGDCVTIDKCTNETVPETTKAPAIANELTCGPNQVFKPCGNCEKSCINPNPQCPAQCSRGCFCKDGLYKAPNGDCVTMDKCPIAVPVTTHPPSIVYEMTCGPNQVFKPCENCEKTCSNPNPHCPAQCSRGCFCKDGLYKAPNGDCVKLENCPKGELKTLDK